MIGVLLMMLIISATSIAIIARSKTGAQLVTDSKGGYSAYQASDKTAENVLNNIKKLDDAGSSTTHIPQNTSLSSSDYCSGSGADCFDAGSGGLTSGTVADVYKLESTGIGQGLQRNIRLDLPDRISSGLTSSNFTVQDCGSSPSGCSTHNKCDVIVKVDTAAIDSATMSKIKEFEVRHSTSQSLTNTGASWIYDDRFAGGVATLSIDSSSLGYNQKYYFTAKARTNSPLNLDSLYLGDSSNNALKSVTIGDTSSNPTGGQFLDGLGCTLSHPDPSTTQYATTPYTCCGGTEYYECRSGYVPNTSRTACISTSSCSPITIPSFSASPSSILAGSSSTLSWSATNADSCTVNDAAVSGNTKTVYPSSTTTYTLKCTSSCGASSSASLTVTVNTSKTFNCSAKPATGTVWNSVSSYAQTWNGSAWTPADSTTVYNTTASTTSCRYACASGYNWNGSSCVAATQTYNCSAKPTAGTVWNTVSSYTQTWSGSDWTPAASTTAYNATASTTSCRYKCATNYTWNGSSCVCGLSCSSAPSCTYGYTGSCSVNTSTCTISDTRTCNSAPSCSISWGSSLYRTTDTIVLYWSSANTAHMYFVSCSTPVGLAWQGVEITPLIGSLPMTGPWPAGSYSCSATPYASNGAAGSTCSTGIMRVLAR